MKVALDHNIYPSSAFKVYYRADSGEDHIPAWKQGRPLLYENKIIFDNNNICELRLHTDGHLVACGDLFRFLNRWQDVIPRNQHRRFIPKKFRRNKKCMVCGKHKPSDWRRCFACKRWVGRNCRPEQCWRDDDVHRCIICLQQNLDYALVGSLILSEV